MTPNTRAALVGALVGLLVAWALAERGGIPRGARP